MTSPMSDRLAELLSAALEAWGVDGRVVREADGALLLSLSPLRAAQRGEGHGGPVLRAPLFVMAGPDPAIQEPHSTRVEQAALDGRLKAGHDGAEIAGVQKLASRASPAAAPHLVLEARLRHDPLPAGGERESRAGPHESLAAAPHPVLEARLRHDPLPAGGERESRAGPHETPAAATHVPTAAAPHPVLEARLRHDPLLAGGEREKSIRVARAPAGLPFRFAVTIGERERMATGVAGVLRLVRGAVDPDHAGVRLRVGRLPTVTP